MIISRYKHHQSHSTGITDSDLEHHRYTSRVSLLMRTAVRQRAHREKIGGTYTLVITPRYVPAVLNDIKGTSIVIVRASTFAEYLYNHIFNDIREIDYEDFDSIVVSNLGKDISRMISDRTIEKFAAHS